MEVTALCFRLVMLGLISLREQVHNSYTQNRAFLRITPNRLQHFELDSISFDCIGLVGLTHLKAVSNTKEFNPACDSKKTTSSCTIDRVYSGDSGEYWCESEGERSDGVNITITAGPVILDGPALPVMQGMNVILRCRSKNQSTNLGIFYKNDVPLYSTPVEEMEIINVSKSDEGFYKCHIFSIGTSPASWLSVRENIISITSHPPNEDQLFDDSNSKSPYVRILLWVAVTMPSVFLSLLLVGYLYFKNCKVDGEDGANEPDGVTYAVVVTEQKKQTDTADADDNSSLCLETNQGTNPQTENGEKPLSPVVYADGASRQPVYAAVTITSKRESAIRSSSLNPNQLANKNPDLEEQEKTNFPVQ
ncbi:uncharacterized protein LOC113151486 isoform X2 [Anabas testudineus]|uniref:Immunoglobulin domain-containing protein n=1 Tax=Anabas testudineus TaxID=64144 RepID=A0A7N6AX40_ANATE|nr:uncharacterized protein LOC113151486 isoform X2 [Anabas testudineus]